MKVWRWHVMQMKLYARKLRSVGRLTHLAHVTYRQRSHMIRKLLLRNIQQN